jgi:anti-sigma28 factor (negative regulator of flagellin synthesis)
MEITGPGGIGGSPKINADRKPVRVPSRQGGSAGGDKVEISDTARLKGLLANVPEVRLERIAEIKRKIQSGGYPPDDLVNEAFDRMFKEEAGG